MEETETGGMEPVDLRCGDQPELLSLIICGEEEATPEESDLGGKRKNNKQCYYSECFPGWRTVALRGCQSHGHCQTAS